MQATIWHLVLFFLEEQKLDLKWSITNTKHDSITFSLERRDLKVLKIKRYLKWNFAADATENKLTKLKTNFLFKAQTCDDSLNNGFLFSKEIDICIEMKRRRQGCLWDLSISFFRCFRNFELFLDRKCHRNSRMNDFFSYIRLILFAYFRYSI